MDWSETRELLAGIAAQPQVTDRDLVRAFIIAQECPWLDISAVTTMVEEHCPALNRRSGARNVTNIPPRHRREFILLIRDAPINPASDYGLLVNMRASDEITDDQIGLATSIVEDTTRDRRAVRALINEFTGPHARKHEPEYDIPQERRPDYVGALLRMLGQ